MSKVLIATAANEGVTLSSTILDNIASSSAGDVRHALNTLQFHCLNMSRDLVVPVVKGKKVIAIDPLLEMHLNTFSGSKEATTEEGS